MEPASEEVGQQLRTIGKDIAENAEPQAKVLTEKVWDGKMPVLSVLYQQMVCAVSLRALRRIVPDTLLDFDISATCRTSISDTCSPRCIQVLQPAVADAAGQATYAADRITGEAIQPVAKAIAEQVLSMSCL